jgi:hypothetical protein
MSRVSRATALVLAAGALCAGASGAVAATADRVTAPRAVLRLADLPAGWTASPRSGARTPSACAGYRRARAAVSAHANSQNFSHLSSQASHTVYLYANARRARSAFGRLTSAAARRCVGAETKTKLERLRSTVGAARTSRLRIARVGDQSAMDRIAVDYRASDGETATLTLDLVYVREGRGLSLFALVDETTTFDARLRARLTSTADRRLRKLLAG